MLISPFGVLNSYKKGQIVECSGLKRDCVRILLSGKVSFYDPLSSKSYKNCLIKIKNKEYNMELIRNGISLFEKSLFVYSTSLKQSLEYNEAGK